MSENIESKQMAELKKQNDALMKKLQVLQDEMDRAKCISNKSLSNESSSPTSSLRYHAMITRERRPSTHVNFNNLNSID